MIIRICSLLEIKNENTNHNEWYKYFGYIATVDGDFISGKPTKSEYGNIGAPHSKTPIEDK